MVIKISNVKTELPSVVKLTDTEKIKFYKISK
jgi:hypothetical protein